ncbi:MAG: HEPN domain-containing protein [Patescibacteria group bacterium]|nr:HEPN domain-containing protein [Patescibacteria group bacterium]
MDSSLISKKVVKVHAHCLFPLSTNGKYSFKFGSWKLIEHNNFIAIFETNIDINNPELHREYYKLLNKLECILSAVYLIDFIPKRIDYFEIEKLSDLTRNEQIRLVTIFGNKPFVPTTIEHEAHRSFSSMGMVHMFLKAQRGINYSAPTQDIKTLYEFLNEHTNIANSTGLIREGYWNLNYLNQNQLYGYFNEYSLRSAILLIVSGLENIFTKGAKQEIIYQFSTIGSIYYDRFVTNDYFNQFDNVKKIPSRDFRIILKKLYDIRSAIAHGSSGFLGSKIKETNEIFCRMGMRQVQYKNIQLLRANALMLFSFLQPHIHGIIVQAKEKLSMGGEIIEDTFIN